MSWKYEIFRCFFLAFGMFEVITNLRFLMKKDGLDLAIKQHGELPKGISEKNKVKSMLYVYLWSTFFHSRINIIYK